MRELPPYPRAVLLAKSPERLDEETRRRKYDEPLARLLGQRTFGRFLRGFSPRDVAGEVAWIGLEVELVTSHCEGPVIAFLVDAGAPLGTVVEVETERSTSEPHTLAWWAGLEPPPDPDREFYDRLGRERPERPCRASGCPRGAVDLSVFCRPHHFEHVMGRPCPFRG